MAERGKELGESRFLIREGGPLSREGNPISKREGEEGNGSLSGREGPLSGRELGGKGQGIRREPFLFQGGKFLVREGSIPKGKY